MNPLANRVRFWQSANFRETMVCFAVITSLFMWIISGRIDSGDATSQAKAAMILVAHARLSAPDRAPDNLWIASRSGRFYQYHDLGNVLLMSLPAWVGKKAWAYNYDDFLFDRPPRQVRALMAITVALTAAVGITFFFRAMRRFFQSRQAIGLALMLALGTFFLPYVKTGFDVVACAVAVMGLIWTVSVALSGPTTTITMAAAIGFFLGLIGTFRYSVAPFVGLSVIALVILRRDRFAIPAVLALAIGTAATLVPMFIYNYVRMGNPLIPATASPAFKHTNALATPMTTGLYGLLMSPNRGVIWFAPVIALSPFGLWKPFRVDPTLRQITNCLLLGAIGYLCVVSKLIAWDGSMGWGPRYVVPVLPILFLASIGPLLWLCEHRRNIAAIFIIACVTISTVPAMVDWVQISINDNRATHGGARMPYQQIAVWRALIYRCLGYSSDPHLAPGGIVNIPDGILLRTVFGATTTRARIAAGASLAFLALVIGYGIWILSRSNTAPDSPVVLELGRHSAVNRC